jgi:predicted glycogen debranching enzyme
MQEMVGFGPDVLSRADGSLEREWLETNGIGGFASSTIWGMNTRRYHGLLVAATAPPVGRIVLLSKLEETVIIGDEQFELSTNRYPGVFHPQGFRYLFNFRLDPFPTFRYQVGEVQIEKTLFMVHGENTTVAQYMLVADRPCRLEIRPLIAFRDYHSLTHENEALRNKLSDEGTYVSFQPYDGLPALFFAHENASLEKTGHWYRNCEYVKEQERGLGFREDLFNPFVLTLELTSGATTSIVVSTSRPETNNADLCRDRELRRRSEVVARAPFEDSLASRLVTAADHYIVNRGQGKTIIAGYHWFSDWGRDTMIALPGITLVTGRQDAARAILTEFASHVSRGMVPNRFPDAGEAPEYNTVDAALWFFEAARAYFEYTGDKDFVLQQLFPKLNEIIDCYLAGTRYGIRVDSDGLVYAGEPGTQLTWMDAKIGDFVVTPRRGKPVEIQALWYNALCIQRDLAQAAGDRSREETATRIAEQAHSNFNRLFWNDHLECLFDVVDGDRRDSSIRPNQIFAVSLRNSLVDTEVAGKILQTIEKHLLTPLGLRSLAPSDPNYRPYFRGGVEDRDSAYHQGTVWPWLMGPFITAYLRVHRRSFEAMKNVRGWLRGFEGHLDTAGLGHISEVSDGASPNRPGGCIAQAWSVGEILRAIAEDVLKITPADRRGTAV